MVQHHFYRTETKQCDMHSNPNNISSVNTVRQLPGMVPEKFCASLELGASVNTMYPL